MYLCVCRVPEAHHPSFGLQPTYVGNTVLLGALADDCVLVDVEVVDAVSVLVVVDAMGDGGGGKLNDCCHT